MGVIFTKKIISVFLSIIMLFFIQPSITVSAKEMLKVTACEDGSIGGWSNQLGTVSDGGVSKTLPVGCVRDNDGKISLDSLGEGMPYMAYFKFDLPEGVVNGSKEITSAKLKINVKNTKNWGVEIKKTAFYKVSSNSWRETSLTHKNSVNYGGINGETVCVDEISGKKAPDYIESRTSYTSLSAVSGLTLKYDLTDFINLYNLTGSDGKISFALLFVLGETPVYIDSKDNSDVMSRPSIEYTLDDISPLSIVSPPADKCRYDETINVGFNYPLNPETVLPQTMELYRGNERIELQNGDVSVSGNMININAEKEPYRTYTLKFKNGIEDIYGNTFYAKKEYNFSTQIPLHSETIMPSAFISAMYQPNNPSHTGDRSSPGTGGNTGWLPYLYLNGTYCHYYGKIDLSALLDKSVSAAEYNLFVNGDINIGIYRVDGDFTPGTTPYSELPAYGDKIASAQNNSEHGKYIKLDITNYVRECLLNNRTSLGFMIKQEAPSQTVLASETTMWSDGAWEPSVTALCADSVYAGAENITPQDKNGNIAVSENLVFNLYTDVSGITSSNVEIKNLENGSIMPVGSGGIAYDRALRRVEIDPFDDLEENSRYSITFKDLESIYETEPAPAHTCEFKTGENLEITENSITYLNGKYTVNAVIKNNMSTLTDPQSIIMALYNSMRMVGITVKKSGTVGPLGSAQINAEISCAEECVTHAKVYVWKSLEGMRPIWMEYGISAPSEERVLSDINQKLKNKSHPYLHATVEKLDDIRMSVENGNDAYINRFYSQVKENAHDALSQPVYAHGGTVTQSIVTLNTRILELMTVYYVERDERYLEKAIAEFENLKGITKWTASAQLDNTQTAATLALCYDWLYDYLTAEQRNWAVETIKTKCLDIAYRYYKNPSELETLRNENDYMNIWCWRGSYNHCVYNNSNLLVCALAIAPEYPEYSAFIMANNLYNVQPYLDLVGEDGGHAEPVGYYGYTTEKIINMLSALQSSLGTMYDYDRYQGFRTTAYYPLYMYGVGPFAFGDTSPEKSVYSSNVLYFLAKYSKNSELLSVIVSRNKGSMAYPLLWYDEGEMNNAEEDVQLPLDKVMSPSTKTQNVASFRNSWDTENSLFTAMYVGCATANGHSDASSGAFCIDVYGERFVTAIGLGNYDYPGYWDQSEGGGRWDWYEKRAEGANALVINPSASPGQSLKANAVMNGFETAAGGGFAWSDLTSVYGDYVTSYKRGIKLYDNRSKVIIQDEAVMKAPSEIFWSINTPAKTEIIDKNTAVMTIGDKKLAMKVYANVDFTLYEMAAEKLPTSPQKSEQKEYPDYRKIAISAPDVTNLNLMVEFTPYLEGETVQSDISEWCRIENWTVY